MDNDSPPTLKITIIGAGIAGLSTALALSRLPHVQHEITIYESSPTLHEYGAGIQLSSNCTRVLSSWGLQGKLEEVFNIPSALEFRRWQDGRELGRIEYNPVNEWMYGSGHWCVYRQDVQKVLFEALGDEVKVDFGRKVVNVLPDEGVVMLEDGERVESDLIICADGIGSVARRCWDVRKDVELQPFKEHYYRAIIPREKMMRDQETREVMEKSTLAAWAGPGVMVLVYVVGAGKYLNVVVSVPRPNSDAPVAEWNQKGDVEEMKGLLEGWCPVVRKIADLIERADTWTLAEVPTLERYVSENGKLVLIGDAAHAVLPYANQGGGMAVEDAAAMEEFLLEMKSEKDLPRVLKAWEQFRRPRWERIRRTAYGNANMTTLPDGEMQAERDRQWATMANASTKQMKEVGEGKMAEQLRSTRAETSFEKDDYQSAGTRMYANGYDVIEEARKAVKELDSRTNGTAT